MRHRLSPLESLLCLRSQFELAVLSLSLSPLFYFIPSTSLSLFFALYDSFRPTLRPIHSPLRLSLSVHSFFRYLRLAFVHSGSSLANSHRLCHPRSRNCSLTLRLSRSPSFFFFPFVLPSFLALFLYLSFHLFSSSCSVCSMYIIYTSLAPDHRAVAQVLVQPAKVGILIFA